MEPILIARIAVLLIGTAIAGYVDARKGIIPDKVTYPMVAIGIVLNLIEFDLMLFAIAAIVFAICYILYWLGKVGGGDVKLLAAIALLLPSYGGNVLIVHALLAAAILSIVFYSVYYVGRYWRKGLDFKENRQSILSSLLLGIIIIFYFSYLVSMHFISETTAVILYATIFFALFFLAFERGIKRNFFLREVEIGKLEEDEVIATEFLNEDIRNKLKLYFKGIFGKKEVEELRKMGIMKVPVYRDMPPFAPFVFIGIVIVLLKPELFGFLVI